MKIGIMSYFATGEGVTLFIMSGSSEKEILDKCDDYWHVGFKFYDAKELREHINSELTDNEDYEYVSALLESHTPIFFKYFYNSGCSTVDYKLHYNLS